MSQQTLLLDHELVSVFMIANTPVASFFPPVYTNRDGLTGFGMPQEIRSNLLNYTILCKPEGGNIGGYSAHIFSFVPELQLSNISS